MIKNDINQLIATAIKQLQKKKIFPTALKYTVLVEKTRHPNNGDYASNIALTLAKQIRQSPACIAKQLVAVLPKHHYVKKISIAHPGFINFVLNDAFYYDAINETLSRGENYGHNMLGQGKTVHLEYISANPTGPLHVGHGRGAVYGSCVANLLRASNFKVHSEYYVNDAGRQMRILAFSIWIRYLQRLGIDVKLPDKAYVGDYILDIAHSIEHNYGDQFSVSYQKYVSLLQQINTDNTETYLDQCIAACEATLGPKTFDIIFQFGLNAILDDIKNDLNELNVTFDEWFSEQQLLKQGFLNKGITLLKTHGFVYEQDQALWFKASQFGDEKDRVLIRANGQPTYFASDVAYHLYKYEQHYDTIIDIFGADHHGYINRIHGFLKALGKDAEKTIILLVQFAMLYRGKEKISMSTRAGKFITLRELRQEVGLDAARFFYIMRKPEQHLDFDLELAKKRSNENPVYYIQYAHARICSVQENMIKQGKTWNKHIGLTHLNQLNLNDEKNLMKAIAQFPDMVASAARQYAPHQLAHYLQEIAGLFHSYYNATYVLVEQETLRHARLCLIMAVQQVLSNGLKLLGIGAPKSM